jgi:acetyltransferase-like isoleucine patch superfamily enzyme
MKIVTVKDYAWNKLVVQSFYKRKFSSIGTGLHVMGKASIGGVGKVQAGNNLCLRSSGPKRIGLWTFEKNAVLNFGNNVFINSRVDILCWKRIEVGDFTLIGNDTLILDSDWHGIDGAQPKVSPIKIGSHVWIAMRVIILKGVTIGDNAIIGAGSVVTRNVEKNTIVAGNPIRQIGLTKTGYC